MSTLSIYFSNVTFLGRKARKHIAQLKHHVIGVAETHLRENAAIRADDQMRTKGWVVSQAPAAKSPNSSKGTNGGMMLMHKPWLQTAAPTAASGDRAQWLDESYLAWKHFRIRGLHFIIVFCHLESGVGLQGTNLARIRKLASLTDGGRIPLMCLGDFNVDPSEWQGTGLLEALKCQVIVAGEEPTCYHAYGKSTLEYGLFSLELMGLVQSFRTVADVPWKPHLGLELVLNRRPEHITTQQIQHVEPLPTDPNMDTNWHVTDSQWQSTLTRHDDARNGLFDQHDDPAST